MRISLNLADRLGRLSIAGVSCIVLLYLALPLLVVIAISFTETEYLKFPPQGFTLRWYWKVVSDPTFVEAFVVSSQLAAAATATALLLGVPAALVFARKQFRGARALSAVFLSPLVLPTIVLGVAILQYASALGFARSFWALYVGHVVLVTPYVIRTSLASLSGMDADARGGGAGPRRHAHADVLPHHPAADKAGRDRGRAVRVHQLVDQRRGEHLQLHRAVRDRSRSSSSTTSSSTSIRRWRPCRRSTIYIAILVVVAIDLAVGIEKAAVNTTADARS